MRALIYVRNSSASLRSVEEQEAESRAECERREWEVATVVADMVGASRHSKGTRLGWQRVKKLLPDHDVLVTWESSRAQRDMADYAELRDLCAKNGVLWCYSGRLHDLSTSDGRFRTGLDALLAEREADEMAERIQRAMRANAAKGMPHGRRQYGYQRTYDPTTGALTGQVPHPLEADVVRGIFADYLAGVPVRAIARRLTEAGVLTTKGTAWRDAQVRNLLRRPAYAAKRVHRGVIVGDAAWEPLVPWETFERVQARMEASAAQQVRYTHTARLLTGVARCGRCGARMFVGHNRGRRLYQCRACFGIVRDQAKLDAFVAGQVLERLEDVGHIEPPLAVVDEAAVLRKRLEEAVGQFTAGKLSAGTLASVEATLLPAIAAAEAKRRREMVPIDVDLPAGDYLTWWQELTPEQRRAVVNALVSAVTIHPATRGSRRFDPDAVVVEWAG